MSTWQIIMIPIVLLVIGLIRQTLILRKKRRSLEMTNEFLRKFLEWHKGEAQDHSLYNWMLKKSETLQAMLGTGGLIDLQRPLDSDCHRDTPIILALVPEIKTLFNNCFRDSDDIRILVQAVDDSLHRFIGLTEERIQQERTRLFNPLVLFCGGVACLMELTLFILSESKIITAYRREIVTKSRIYSLVQGILTLATLIATVMGIIMGWENFTTVVTGWMK